MKTTPPGTQFQNDFVASLSPELTCVRLNDSARGLDHEANPGDYVVFNAQTCNFVELKTSLGKAMSIGNTKSYTIKVNQLNLVCEYGYKPNCEGWYILNFRELSKTYRILARSIKLMYDNDKKKSITIDDCEEFGFKVPEKDCVYDLWFLNPVVNFKELK